MPNYGLIGESLLHSFSPAYFEKKFEQLAITECSYTAFPIDKIESINQLIQQHRLDGFNVTIPFKSSIIAHLDSIDNDALEIGAVNTVTVHWEGEHFSTKGFNTDVIGFRKSLEPLLTNPHERALILGSGGASKAIKWVLNKMSIDFQVVSRSQLNDLTYSDLNKSIIEACTLIINCTPLGTSPNVSEMPDIPWKFLTDKHLVFDLIYNPPESLLLQKANKQGALTKNGYEMLELQADASWKIWQSIDA